MKYVVFTGAIPVCGKAEGSGNAQVGEEEAPWDLIKDYRYLMGRGSEVDAARCIQ